MLGSFCSTSPRVTLCIYVGARTQTYVLSLTEESHTGLQQQKPQGLGFKAQAFAYKRALEPQPCVV